MTRLARERGGARLIAIVLIVAAVLIAATLVLRHEWDVKESLANRAIAGRTQPQVLSGRTYDARQKIQYGMSTGKVRALLGGPSSHFRTKTAGGTTDFIRWTYNYADGEILLDFRGGLVDRVEADFN